MKVLGVISTTAVFLLLGATVPAFAQEEHPEEGPSQHSMRKKLNRCEARTSQAQKQEQQAKPAKQEQAKPEKQQQQAKPQKQEQQAKSRNSSNSNRTSLQSRNNSRPRGNRNSSNRTSLQGRNNNSRPRLSRRREKSAAPTTTNGQAQQSQGQYARNGQKDRDGHEYNESRFGPNHHARFEENGGRYYNGRREYSYGGYWFYAGAYPAWFYQQDVYFIWERMGYGMQWHTITLL